MPHVNSLVRLEREIVRLSPREQLKLVEKLAHNLRQTDIDIKRELNWSELYGLGKDTWEDQDAQDYVNSMRQDRA